MSFAIVVSQFNQSITNQLLQGAITRLNERGILDEDMTVVKVPGAIEIPLAAKLLAQSRKYQAIICLGAIIQGETDHYDYVCQQVSQGCSQIMLQYDMPIIFGILMTQNWHQAEERVGGKAGHKGIEAADTALIMIDVVRKILSE